LDSTSYIPTGKYDPKIQRQENPTVIDSQVPQADRTVRERLLTSAARMFARKGYAATTVREIVSEVGVTKPVLYYYFRNKEGLYAEILHTATARYSLLLDGSRQKKGRAVSRLLDLADQVLALFMEQIEIARLAYSIYYGPPQGAPVFDLDAYHLKFHGLVTELVQIGFTNREFRRGRVEDITWMVLGAVNVALETQLSHPERGFGREGLGRVLKLFFDGIKGDEGPKGTR
jgi:AcrR family transcriptional regulator